MSQSADTETWYKDWFGQDYLKVYPHRDESEARRQVDFVEKNLPLKSGYRILDLGCGNGRHAIEMSNRGHNVTCLDLSAVLLNLARTKTPEKNCCVRFVRADMRHLPFDEKFDAVVSFFTTFGYFESDEQNLATLRSIEHVLKPGGLFMQDYMNKPYVLNNLVQADSRSSTDVDVLQERSYDFERGRVEKKITLKEGSDVREYFESVRLYTMAELEQLLTQTKLRLNRVLGDFDGSPLTEKSPRLIMIGSKT